MKRKTRKLLTLLLLGIFLVSTVSLVRQWIQGKEQDASYADAARMALETEATRVTEETRMPEATQPPTEIPETTAPPEPVWEPAPVTDDPEMEALAATDLDALRQVNPDVLGWIRIPDTNINYPILQGEDNEFYLHHTWEGKENAYGSIYLECQNDPELTDFNTIIYGHNMADKSMFAQLHNYFSEDFWRSHPYVYIVTDDGVFRYEIFSSYFAEVTSPAFGLGYKQTKSREKLIQTALEQSEIRTGIQPETTDRIITLSTCSGRSYATRRVVHARLKMIQSFG